MAEKPDSEKAIKSLRLVKFFEDFTEEQLQDVLKVGELKRYSELDHISREGTLSNSLYIILKGRVAISKDIDRYTRKKLGENEMGECIGEVAFLLDGHRTANIIAATDVMLFRINGSRIGELKPETQLHFYRKIATSLARKLKSNNKLVSELL